MLVSGRLRKGGRRAGPAAGGQEMLHPYTVVWQRGASSGLLTATRSLRSEKCFAASFTKMRLLTRPKLSLIENRGTAWYFVL